MKMQLNLWLGGLRQVEDRTQSGADRFALGLDFGGLDLEFAFPKAVGDGADAAPPAWKKLHEALQEIAAVAKATG